MTFAISASEGGAMNPAEIAASFAEYAAGKLEIMAPKDLRAAAHEFELELYEFLNESRKARTAGTAFQDGLWTVWTKRGAQWFG